MAAQPEYLNEIEREAIYQMRELFAQGREATVNVEMEDTDVMNKWAELALYPEKPVLSFSQEEVEEEVE